MDKKQTSRTHSRKSKYIKTKKDKKKILRYGKQRNKESKRRMTKMHVLVLEQPFDERLSDKANEIKYISLELTFLEENIENNFGNKKNRQFLWHF